MEADGRCAEGGDAVQCLVLGWQEGIPTLMPDARPVGSPGARAGRRPLYC